MIPSSPDINILAQFTTQVGQRPTAVAIQTAAADGPHLTYAELEARSNQVAHYLLGLGVQNGRFVAILTERVPEMLVGLLGILKAGAAYLPLDPTYPAERLAFMLADAQPVALLTQAHLRPDLPPYPGQIVCLDSDWPQITAQSTRTTAVSPNPADLAYIIYTSGSTGQPKGVQISHGALANFIYAMRQQPGLQASDVLLALTTISFDVSVLEMFLPLAVGARIILADKVLAGDASRLAQVLAQHQVTVMSATPITWHLLLAGGWSGRSGLTMFCAGEALSRGLANRLLASGGRLWNMYGPTETTILSSVLEILPGEGPVPIGPPLANTQFYLLDEQLQPVPAGQPGELFIGGRGLAQGYLNRPDLTAERFVSVVVTEGAAPRRLYRTGDQVLAQPDGTFLFLGRLDRQVKLHGHRIELGEIETVLRQHTAVSHCVVTTYTPDDNQAHKRLVAYLTPAETAVSATPQPNLRPYLTAKLPTYMVPTHFVWLNALPLTPNGKVDHNALPPPDRLRRQLPGTYRPPQTPVQQKLTGLWRDLLQLDEIGLDDNFFELGGDSIQAAILVNELQAQLDTYLYVAALFEAPTVAQLAAYLQTHYADALTAWVDTAETAVATPDTPPLTAADVGHLRRLMTPARYHRPAPDQPHPPAIFILSPPRSGSTLLRVMLAGHEQLFAPPELDLLRYDSLGQRQQQLTGEAAYRREGAIRALMAIHEVDAAAAQTMMADWEARDESVADFYHHLQTAVSPRLLVDKSTFYALDTAVLHRAEQLFDNPYYIHLTRHPYGMIYSFENVRLDRLYFSQQRTFSPRRLAELIWLICHQNITQFLATIPARRQVQLQYEALVRQPQQQMARLAAWLELPPQPAMWQPYGDQSRRMTDGLYDLAASRMVGDVKFHEHSGIDPAQADKWRAKHKRPFLSPITQEMAHSLGYETDTAAASLFPLHPAQKRLWFLAQLRPDSPVYNVARAWLWSGELDVAALATAVSHLIRRHAALRTTFVTDAQGQPQQKVLPPTAVSLPPIALDPDACRGLPSRLPPALAEVAARPFALTPAAPPLRLALYRVAADQHILLVVLHHLITDGWSMALLGQELVEMYTAVTHNRPPQLPPLPFSYGQLAQRQHRQHQAADLAYWRQQLQDLTPLSLPTDYPRPAVETFRGQNHHFRLPPALAQAVHDFSRQQQATPFMTLLAAFKLLLHRYTGQDDLIIGTPTANRHEAAAHNLVGCFINLLPLRADVSGNPTFAELVGRVQATTIAAQRHQQLPFDALVEALQPARDLSRQPFFQILFAWQNYPLAAAPTATNLTITPLPLETDTAKYDLTLFLWPDGEGLAGKWEFNSDLFAPATIERLHGHWQTLLTAVLANPSLPLSQAPLLTPPERQQILTEWQGETADLPPNQLIYQLVEQQAAHQPHSLAVAAYENNSVRHSLTYEQLNRQANHLAHRLRQLGIGPERAVAVCLPRSVANVVALLAVLKSGGGYVPIDPDYPLDRIRYIVEDGLETAVIITTPALADQLTQAGIGDTLLPLTAAGLLAGATDQPAGATNPPLLPQSADSMAYMIYTSGTTGRPKGVVVTHRSVLNLIHHYRHAFALGPHERSTQLVSPAFDVSVWEIWTYLAAGASLHIADEATRRSPWLLQEWVQAARITTMFVPTPMVAGLLALAWPATTPLHTLHTAGDKLNHYPPPGLPFTLYNHYGPTESTVYATYCLVPPRPEATDAPPIGRPFTNIHAYILDKYGNPVPVGVPGELYLGGAGVARGYHHRPQLTADRFVAPPPALLAATDRLYKTGDLVRYLPDGQIAFLGRLDHQVKLRGFRIELGEIEAVLAQHPQVQEAVVLVSAGAEGHKQLVAYLLTAAAADNLPEAVARFLQARLPDYMVPARFVVLTAWPLNANGKVDRLALQQMPLTTPDVPTDFVPPQTAVEQTLVDIWQALLPVARVGIHDNFFELGGDSILSIQIVARARQAGLSLAPQHLFQHQTVAALARLLAEMPAPAAEPAAAEPAAGPLPLTPIQHWFFDQQWPQPHHWHMPLLVAMPAATDWARLRRAWSYLAQQHHMLRARFVQVGETGVWQQSVAAAVPSLPITVVTDEVAWQTAVSQVQRTFNLADGPLFALVVWQRPGADYHLVLMVAHHLLVDGVSWRILLDDWQQLYRQLAAGEPPQLPAPTTSYRQWGHRLRTFARSAAGRAEAAVWRSFAWPDRAELPLDFADGVNEVASAATISRQLTAAETAVFLRQAPATFGTQSDDILLTALAHALRPWLGTDQILLDLEGHGRSARLAEVDLSRTVGWFTAIYPVWLRVGEETAVADLPHIQTQLAQVPDRGAGYLALRYLSDEETAGQLASRPRPRISFNYLGQFDQMTNDLFRVEPDQTVAVQSAYAPQGQRPHLLQVNGLVSNGRLQLNLRYSQNLHRAATISQVADRFLGHLRQILQAAQTAPAPPAPAASAVRWPLAPMQTEILAASASAVAGSTAYQVQWQARLHGPLDLSAWRETWTYLLARHAPLRSSFPQSAVATSQAVVPDQLDLPCQILDWSDLSEQTQAERLAALAVPARQQPLSVAAPPLLRLTLIKLGVATYHLLWQYHHLLLDGWSLGLLWPEVTAVYQALTQKQSPDLPPLIPYRRYLDWIGEQPLGPAQAAWQTALGAFRPALTWQVGSTAVFAEVNGRLRQTETAVLQKAARQRRLTVNTLVQAAWGLTLARHTGQNEVTMGVVDAGRALSVPGIERMVGLLANALPLRLCLPDAVDCPDWLAELQAQQLAVRPYAFCSQAQLRRWYDLPVNGPLFDNLLRFQNYPLPKPLPNEERPFTISQQKWHDYWHYPLNVVIIPGRHLQIKIGYDTAQISEPTARQMLADFQHYLVKMAERLLEIIGK